MGIYALTAFLQKPTVGRGGNAMTSVPTQAVVTSWLLPDLWAFWDQLALDQM